MVISGFEEKVKVTWLSSKKQTLRGQKSCPFLIDSSMYLLYNYY
jgi:hypothetical protein